MLSKKQVEELRRELETAQNPLFIYDSDADGLCSFLLLYRFCKEGKGFIFKKASKNLYELILNKIEEQNPDKIFILDIPVIDQEFFDKVKRPVFWIDHHPPLTRTKVKYYNPLIRHPDIYMPVTRMAYQIAQNPDDLWLAAVGTLGDYARPDFLPEFIEKYPALLEKEEDLPTILFKRPVGELVKLFFFMFKGPSSEVTKSMKILTRIKSPDEIMEGTTAQGKFIFKRFQTINQRYEILLKQAKKCATRSKLLLFFYSENQWSFTANLANELTALYPNKIIIIARKKSEEVKCSIRARVPFVDQLKQAMVGLQARGGGHPNACGAVIDENDWEQFLEKFKGEIKNLPKLK